MDFCRFRVKNRLIMWSNNAFFLFFIPLMGEGFEDQLLIKLCVFDVQVSLGKQMLSKTSC